MTLMFTIHWKKEILNGHLTHRILKQYCMHSIFTLAAERLNGRLFRHWFSAVDPSLQGRRRFEYLTPFFHVCFLHHQWNSVLYFVAKWFMWQGIWSTRTPWLPYGTEKHHCTFRTCSIGPHWTLKSASFAEIGSQDMDTQGQFWRTERVENMYC